MKRALEDFSKEKDFIICIDSDGCVMDTMDVKHMRCFGPYLVYEWGLQEYRQDIIRLWRKVNLLAVTRGINRFAGLAKVLEQINENYMIVEGLEDYLEWTRNTAELSEKSLEAAYQEKGTLCMKKALEWSHMVNQSMVLVSNNRKMPFEGAEEAMIIARQSCDIAILTAAIGDEIQDEWETNDMNQHVDLLMSQETGKKADCLKRIVEKGYARDHVMMVGDAIADLEAAQEAGVLFYPIMAYRERDSWENFPLYLQEFLNGTYDGQAQDKKIREFVNNFVK